MRLYRWFLRLLPREFRHQHGEEIERTFADALGDRPARKALLPLFWMRVAFDLLVGIAAAWAAALRGQSERATDPGSDRAHRAIGKAIPREGAISHLSSDRGAERAVTGVAAIVGAVLQDTRYGMRSLWTSPGFTFMAVCALALGIGANAAVFTLVNEIVLRPLPLAEPRELIGIYIEQPGTNSFSGFSYPEYLDYRERNGTLRGLGAHRGISLWLGYDAATQIFGQLASDNYLAVLGVEPARGRIFTAEEATSIGTAPVAVVSHGFWMRRFGGDPGFLGSTIRLNDTPFTVIGVLPPGFNGRFIGFPSEVWIPLTMLDSVSPGTDLESRRAQGLELVGRLSPGATVDSAQAALNTIAAQLESEYPGTNRDRRISVARMTGVDRSLRAPVMSFLGILMILAGLVLVMACLNVGNLLLVRGNRRQGEISIRLALGANRTRLIRQLLTETAVLFVLGALVSIGVALAVNDVLRSFIDSLPIPLGFDLALDVRVLLLAGAATLITAIGTGLSPAFRATNRSQAAGLRAKGPRGGGARLRSSFVVGQIAASVVLLVAAGLFLQAFWRGRQFDPGFDTEGLTLAAIGLPDDKYSADEARIFFRTLSDYLEADPRTRGVAVTMAPPVGVARSPTTVAIPGHEPPAGREGFVVDVNVIDVPYFSMLGIPFVEGRDFRDADGQSAARVAIINRDMARRFWPDESAVGKQLTREGVQIEVIGVVEDTQYVLQDDTPSPLMYLLFEQVGGRRMGIVLRSSADLPALNSLLREEVQRLDAALPRPNLESLDAFVAVSLLPQRVASRFAGAIGILGLLLAIAGVYGIVSYSLSSRRREFGIRLALGAGPDEIVGLVVRYGLVLVAWGAVIGVAAAAMVTQLLRGFLVGLSPLDPITYAVVIGTIATITMIAAYLPARRAGAIDPGETLREE